MNKTNLRQTLHAYQRLLDVARDLATTLDLDTLLNHIVQLAADLNEAEEASILLYEPKKQQLFFQASTDLENAAKMRGITIPAESIAGWVALHREPVIVTDVLQDSRFFRNIDQVLQFKTRSIVAVPMIHKDELIGVLEVLNKRTDTFTPLDQEIMVILAGQASVAITNARLFSQSDLIAELVHELRTPLSSINTIAYLLQRQGVTEPQRIALAQTIQSEAGRLNELSSSYLDLASLESGRYHFKQALFEPEELLRESCEVIRSMAAECKITLELHIPPQLPPVNGDRDKIKQVLLNLLTNAVKYNCSGGSIFASIRVENNQLWFSVRDTGLGIPANLRPRLFEKFFRANPSDSTTPGTGLGLYICKKIIENHGGGIEAASQENEGTTFQFFLPLNL
jgi:signal transduction histidine kinase